MLFNFRLNTLLKLMQKGSKTEEENVSASTVVHTKVSSASSVEHTKDENVSASTVEVSDENLTNNHDKTSNL